MLYLTNAFSLSMLSTGHSTGITVEPITAKEAAALLDAAAGEQGWRSTVGHADTAAVFQSVLGVPVQAHRESIAVDVNYDHMIVGQYTGPRLPEGATTLPEGAEIQWFHLEFTVG